MQYTKVDNKKGSVNWRCQHSRDKYGCKATCTTVGGLITIFTKGEHTCPKIDEFDLALHDAKRSILKYITEAPTTSHP